MDGRVCLNISKITTQHIYSHIFLGFDFVHMLTVIRDTSLVCLCTEPWPALYAVTALWIQCAFACAAGNSRVTRSRALFFVREKNLTLSYFTSFYS